MMDINKARKALPEAVVTALVEFGTDLAHEFDSDDGYDPSAFWSEVADNGDDNRSKIDEILRGHSLDVTLRGAAIAVVAHAGSDACAYIHENAVDIQGGELSERLDGFARDVRGAEDLDALYSALVEFDETITELNEETGKYLNFDDEARKRRIYLDRLRKFSRVKPEPLKDYMLSWDRTRFLRADGNGKFVLRDRSDA